MIPLTRPYLDDAETAAFIRVVESGWIVQGPVVEEFEERILSFCEGAHCIAVSSGTAALHVAFLAAGLRPHDAVFLPSFAWPAAANVCHLMGAHPVFVDVLPGTYNIDPVKLEAAIAQCQNAGRAIPRLIVPVHQFGLMADMDSIGAIAGKYGLQIIEDGACAFGAEQHGRKLGSTGLMTTLSFHPRKSITTGEGGAIITHDDELALRCRALRNHGQSFDAGERVFALAGLNYRMTEFQAALGIEQTKKFPGILAARREIAARYQEALADSTTVRPPNAEPGHTWQTYMVTTSADLYDGVLESLHDDGVGAAKGSVAGHRGRAFATEYGCSDADFPVSAQLEDHGLAIPLFPQMTEAEIEQCAKALARASRGPSSQPS